MLDFTNPDATINPGAVASPGAITNPDATINNIFLLEKVKNSIVDPPTNFFNYFQATFFQSVAYKVVFITANLF